jgi:hypothetical protein
MHKSNFLAQKDGLQCRSERCCGGRSSCGDHDCDGLAAAFGARISCRGSSQEAWARPCFRADREGSGISDQGRQSLWPGPNRQCKRNAVWSRASAKHAVPAPPSRLPKTPREIGNSAEFIKARRVTIELWRMSQLGQKRKSARLNGMSVLPPTADVGGPPQHVRVVPGTDSQQQYRTFSVRPLGNAAGDFDGKIDRSRSASLT